MTDEAQGDDELRIPRQHLGVRQSSRFMESRPGARTGLLTALLFAWAFGLTPFPSRALDWVTADGYRYAQVSGLGEGKTGFTRLAPNLTGIQFTSQNFFAVGSDTARYDAGRGLWLRGDGQGGFAALDHSGVAVYGEQRGCALGDFDQDGRIDLAVAQNGAGTKLFRNRGARPGLRIRLRGPVGNPHGIGAVLRLSAGSGFGPGREVAAGSGYWSQNSPVQVLARLPQADKLWVRWPGGKVTETPLPSNAMEVVVDESGRVEVK